MGRRDRPQQSKGNPAWKRMVNERRKARRHECWERGRRRRDERRKAQRGRESANKTLRALGRPTPWQEAKQIRANKREARARRRLVVSGYEPEPTK